MQDFIDQAIKNRVALIDEGRCQFCGAGFQRGVFDCMDNYNRALVDIDFNDSCNHIYKFLSVDAHALQHPEIHGRWSNHFHLTRLNLILDKNQSWDYNKSPLLSNYINRYKSNRSNELLSPPACFERGTITTENFVKRSTPEECKELIRRWAAEVYKAWQPNHAIASQIASGFLTRMKETPGPAK